MIGSSALKVTTPSDREIVMYRPFNAPRRLVWEAMTKPELIKRWLFLPPGWSMTKCEEDPRVGGKFRWEWAGPDGNTAMAVVGTYREVVPPAEGGKGGRIVRTEMFEFGCTPQAGEQLVTLTMTEPRSSGTTLVTINILFPSKEARDGMIASGMEQGVAAGYDKLEAMLAAQQA